MSRSRDFVFTLNNYTEAHIELLSQIDCTYVVYGKETGESGTPHLQGYIRFKNQKTMSAVIKQIKGAHIEIKKGSCDQAIQYCKKDGDVYERGEAPASQEEKGQRGKAKMAEILKRAREGDEQWLEDNHPGEFYRHLATFRSHKKPKTEIIEGDLANEWWVGETGTGKSKKLWEDYPEHYRKDQNKWWDGYVGQDVVAIEEASPETCQKLASRMKQWADRYPFDGEIKGGKIFGIRPAKVIVLSNYTIEQCFPKEEDSGPMKRRFKVVRFGVPPSAIHPLYTVPE